MRNTNIGRNEDDLEFGVIVGKRTLDQLYEDAIVCRGRIEIWHEGKLIMSELFWSKQHRATIIDKWDALYKFSDKKDVYFQIKYA